MDSSQIRPMVLFLHSGHECLFVSHAYRLFHSPEHCYVDSDDNDDAYCNIHSTNTEYLKTLDDNIYTIYIPRCSSSISPKVCTDSIPEDSFSRFKGVQWITMESNGISSVERGAFRGVKRIHRLSLEANRISKLYQHQWVGLESLEQLSLEWNGIFYIENDTFRNLESMGHLDLMNNDITHLYNGTFTGLA